LSTKKPKLYVSHTTTIYHSKQIGIILGNRWCLWRRKILGLLQSLRKWQPLGLRFVVLNVVCHDRHAFESNKRNFLESNSWSDPSDCLKINYGFSGSTWLWVVLSTKPFFWRGFFYDLFLLLIICGFSCIWVNFLIIDGCFN
jgi:hypothetical protein